LPIEVSAAAVYIVRSLNPSSSGTASVNPRIWTSSLTSFHSP